MTVAAVAAGAVANRVPKLPKSATLGALVFLAGAALVYWSLYRSRDGKGLFGLGANATAGASWLQDAAAGIGPDKRLTGPLGDKSELPGLPDAPRRGAGGGQKHQ